MTFLQRKSCCNATIFPSDVGAAAVFLSYVSFYLEIFRPLLLRIFPLQDFSTLSAIQIVTWTEVRRWGDFNFCTKIVSCKNPEGKKIFWHANSNFNNLSLKKQPASQMLARCFFTTPLMVLVPQCPMYMTCTVDLRSPIICYELYNMNNVHWTCTITLSASSTVLCMRNAHRAHTRVWSVLYYVMYVLYMLDM